jgi:hypothetical protein
LRLAAERLLKITPTAPISLARLAPTANLPALASRLPSLHGKWPNHRRRGAEVGENLNEGI